MFLRRAAAVLGIGGRTDLFTIGEASSEQPASFVRVDRPAPSFVPRTGAQGVVLESGLSSGWNGDPIRLANGDRTVRITPITRELIRIEEIGPGQSFVDDPTYFAMNRGATASELSCRIIEMGTSTVIDTGAMRLRFEPDGKRLHAGNLEVRSSPASAKSASYRKWRWDPGKPNEEKSNLGGGFRTQDLHGVRKEKNHHGGLQLDSGILSKQGFFCYDDSRGPIFSGGFPRRRTEGEQGTDLYLFGYGRDYSAALRGLAQIGCSTPMPNGPLLGAIDSWWQPLNQQQYLERAESYLTHGYPLDAMVFDMEALSPINPAWSWSRWSWNRDLIPDPRGMNATLHRQSLMTALNLHPHPGVAKGESGYERLMNALRDNGFLADHGYDVRGAESGQTVTAVWTDPRYVSPWIEFVLKPLREDGVDTWWLDYQPTMGKDQRGVPEMTDIEGLTVGALLTHLLYHESSGVNLAQPAPDHRPLEERKRGALMARFEGPKTGPLAPHEARGFLGSHRYPMQFSGDTFVQFPILASQVRMTAASGNVLASFWTHDIGGLLHDKEPELYARWTWFGALSAALRIHGFNNAARAGHDPAATSDGDPRPWRYGDQTTEATRRAYHLRSQLFPYIYSQVWSCHREAAPLIQQMYVQNPSKRQAYHNAQQYMLGRHLLVAPIVTEGRGPNKVASQAVWFPEGNWYHLLTGERFRGDDRVMVSGDLNEVPVFAKGGVPLPTQPVALRMGSEQVKTLVVRAYPGRDGVQGESVLHEDDRLTQAYREDGFASTKMSYLRRGERVTIEVSPAEGRFKGQLEERELRFELPATERASTVSIDGRQLEQISGASLQYDAETRTNLITVPSRSIRAATTLEVEVREIDPKEAHQRALARRIAGRFEDADTTPIIEQIAKRAGELANANAEDDDRLKGLLELAGIGFLTPENGPYGWSPFETHVLQPFYGARTAYLEVEDRCEGSVKRILEKELRETRSGRENIPLPALESDGRKVERFVTMRLVIGGRPITISRKIGEASMRRAFAPANPAPWDKSKPHPRDVTPEVTVNGLRVDETDRIGLVRQGSRTAVNQAIRDAVGRHGGPRGIGYPASWYTDDGSVEARLAHRWIEDGRDFGVTIQNFNWGDPSYGDCAVVHRDGADRAFVIRGDFWKAYSDRGKGRCAGMDLGFPIGDERVVRGKRVQDFERGSMTEAAPGRFVFGT